MNAWDIYTWDFPGAGPHPVVIISHPDRIKYKEQLNVLLGSSQRANRTAKVHEVLLDSADRLDWTTLIKCDLIYAVEESQLKQKRGTVGMECRRQIARKIIQCTALGV